jgi:hypothetical protein
MSTGYELQRFERLENVFYEYVCDEAGRTDLLRDLLILLRQYQQENQTSADWSAALLKRFA